MSVAPALAFCPAVEITVAEEVAGVSDEMKDWTSVDSADGCVEDVKIKDIDDVDEEDGGGGGGEDNDDDDSINGVDVDNNNEDVDVVSELGGGVSITVSVETKEIEAVVIWVTVLASGIEDVDTPVCADDTEVEVPGGAVDDCSPAPAPAPAAAVKRKNTLEPPFCSDLSREDSHAGGLTCANSQAWHFGRAQAVHSSTAVGHAVGAGDAATSQRTADSISAVDGGNEGPDAAYPREQRALGDMGGPFLHPESYIHREVSRLGKK